MQQFLELARKLFAEQLDRDPQEIELETTFEELDADSIDIVELIMALEDIYDIEFPEEDLEDFPTFGSLVHLASLDSFGVPYFAPFAPTRYAEIKDSLIRAPLKTMNKRPASIPHQDNIRQERIK
jgi:acyl carrier protein